MILISDKGLPSRSRIIQRFPRFWHGRWSCAVDFTFARSLTAGALGELLCQVSTLSRDDVKIRALAPQEIKPGT